MSDSTLIVKEENQTIVVSAGNEDLQSVLVVDEQNSGFIVERLGIQGPPGPAGSGLASFSVNSNFSADTGSGAWVSQSLSTPYYYLTRLVASCPGIRVRGYFNNTYATSDLGRPVTTPPERGSGLSFEAVTSHEMLEVVWAPAVVGHVDPTEMTIWIRIDNVGDSTASNESVSLYLYGDPI